MRGRLVLIDTKSTGDIGFVKLVVADQLELAEALYQENRQEQYGNCSLQALAS